MNYKKPKAYLLHATPLALGEVGGRVCYDSFKLSENEDIRNFKQNHTIPDIDSSELLNKLVWAYQHESIVEHINLSYYIEDISREVVIEMNRSRIGVATSQKSTRYTMEPIVDAWIEFSDDKITWNTFQNEVAKNIVDLDSDMIEITASYISAKLHTYNRKELLIKGLTGSKKKKQNDRVKRCLPEVWLMEGVWTFNLRALKHFYTLRSSGSAYYGIREVVDAIIAVTPQSYLELISRDFKENQ